MCITTYILYRAKQAKTLTKPDVLSTPGFLEKYPSPFLTQSWPSLRAQCTTVANSVVALSHTSRQQV